MNQYLSWGEIASTAIDVALTILSACLLASLLIYAFALFGRKYSLDPRVFPTVTARQRQWFGFLGFYLLVLIAIEILNPPSLEYVSSGSINYQPSFLSSDMAGLSVQTWISLVALICLLVYFVQRVRQLNRTNARLSRYSAISSDRSEISDFAEKSQRLRVAFGYCALSFLIAIIAPGLDNLGISSIGSIIILGLFLIAGVACYLEAMQLGAQFAGISRRDMAIQLTRHVFLSRIALYLMIGLTGYLFYSGLPRHFANDPNISALPDLMRTVSTIVAGVVLLLAAFLVCWGLDGFSLRMQRFMVLAALTPAILPLVKITASIFGQGSAISTDPSSAFAIIYAAILLVTPVLFYIYAAPDAPSALHGEAISLAYVRSLGWAPLSIGQSLAGAGAHERWSTTPYATAEELLDDLVGRHARTGGDDRLGWLTPIRKRMDAVLGWDKTYDALVLDARSAIRLMDAVECHDMGRSQNRGYQIVAGICRYNDALVVRKSQDESKSTVGIWADAPYLPRNPVMESLINESFRDLTASTDLAGVDYLPPNVIGEMLPQGTVAALADPFATDLMIKAELRGDTDRLPMPTNVEANWLFDNYDLILASTAAKPADVSALIQSFANGRDWLRMKTGPTGLGNSFARQIAADLEGVPVRELESEPERFLSPVAVSVSLAMTDFHGDSVIDPADSNSGSSWHAIETLYQRMAAAGLIEAITLDQLAASVDCQQIAALTPPEVVAATYPVSISRYLVSDQPGKVSEILEALDASDISLSFLLAQRIYGEGGMGVVYMLPTNPADEGRIARNARQQEWVASGHSGFLAISIDHTPGELRKLLGRIHSGQDLSVESLTVFPTSADRAIVLVSFGNIGQKQLDHLLIHLADDGYEILSDPATWTTLVNHRSDSATLPKTGD